MFEKNDRTARFIALISPAPQSLCLMVQRRGHQMIPRQQPITGDYNCIIFIFFLPGNTPRTRGIF